MNHANEADVLRLEEMLREQGEDQASAEELPAVLARLAEWHAPSVDTEDTARLVSALAPLLPGITSAHRVKGESPRVREAINRRFARPRSSLGWLLETALLQGMLVRPSFWLASTLITALGILVTMVSIPATEVLVLRLLGPLLATISVGAAFRSIRLNTLEIELSCPASPLRLMIARLVLVLGYDVLLGLVVSVALALLRGQTENRTGNSGLTEPVMMTVGLWLAPLLLVAGLAMLLSLRLPVEGAMAVAYAGWLVLLLPVLAEGAEQAPGFFTSLLDQGEAVIAIAGVTLMGLALWRMRAALPLLLLRA